jgi:hypothetical protein
MTRDQIKAVLDRVLTWPPQRQEDVARMISSIEEQDTSPYQLTDEQAAEVRRRRDDPRSGLEIDEVFGRFRPPGA